MKIKRPIFLVACLILIANLVYADTPKKITNVDWLLMSRKEKDDYILSAMKRLQSQGIPLDKSPDGYITEIDAVTDSPNLKPTAVDSIFTTIVLMNEAKSTKTTVPSRKQPEIKKIEMH